MKEKVKEATYYSPRFVDYNRETYEAFYRAFMLELATRLGTGKGVVVPLPKAPSHVRDLDI